MIILRNKLSSSSVENLHVIMLWDFAICPLKGNICLLIKWLEITLLIHKALLLTSNFSISEARQKALFWTTSKNSSMQFLYFNLNLYVVHKLSFEQIASEFCDLRVIPVEKVSERFLCQMHFILCKHFNWDLAPKVCK